MAGPKRRPPDDEYTVLLARTNELQDEHQQLHQNPYDVEGHRRHREKLHAHLAALHAYVDKLCVR